MAIGMTQDRDEGIALYQDLELIGLRSAKAAFRAALDATDTGPWRHAVEREGAARLGADVDSDAMAWERDTDGSLPAAGLLLWGRDDGFAVVNIVPLEVSELDVETYNALLAEFTACVVEPAARGTALEVRLSAPRQTLEDWMGAEAALALRRFALLANKSTGASHPNDRRRWIEFLLIDRGVDRMGADRLERWLVEVAGFEAGAAGGMVSQYEFARDLLEVADA